MPSAKLGREGAIRGHEVATSVEYLWVPAITHWNIPQYSVRRSLSLFNIGVNQNKYFLYV
jgi:hypothetical protein